MLDGYEHYKRVVYKPWRSRLLSNAAAAVWCKTFGFDKRTHSVNGTITESGVKEFAAMVSGFNSVWFTLSILVAVYFSKKKLITAIGYFAFTSFALSPGLLTGEALLYPWDGPALLFYTLATLAAIRCRKALPFIIAVGMGFKETIVLFSIVPLFWYNLPKKERIKTAIRFGLIAISSKIVFDIIVGNSILFTPITEIREPGGSNMVALFWRNLNELLSVKFNSALLSGAILFPVIFLSKIPRQFKAIAAAYIPFLLVYCVVSEIRLYHELVPLCFIGRED